MNARRCTLLLAAAACLTLAGCAIRQAPVGEDIMPESARAQIPSHWAGPHRSGTVVPNWILSFHDPELTALVADAVERNPDLKAAAARVEASRAAVRIAASSLYPRIAMKGLGERQGQHLSGDLGLGINPPDFGNSGTENAGGAGLDTSTEDTSKRWVYGIAAGAAWEADVWGRIRSKKAAAKAESLALEADYEFARQSLAAAVARAYFTTIEAAQQEANAQETLDIYQEYSKLTDIQKQQGFASDFDVSQIKSRTSSAEDALYTAQQVRAQTIRAIEVVTSHYPAGRFDVRRSFPGQPRAVPAGLPAQILERRPDLIASERRFAAAFHRVNEARTARLPRFVLSAGSGLGTADLDSVGSLNALIWTFAGGITQPIFFGGELQAAQDLRTAEQKAAAASYVGHALGAFEDVENALANDYYLRMREGALGTAVSSSADSVKFGRQQLEQGQVDMFTVLRLTGENLAAKVQLTAIRASRLRERVNLYLALGGDFAGTGAPGK
jgi:NodT family efflux transporter outer membrane factor (OMF) lipoprotein